MCSDAVSRGLCFGDASREFVVFLPDGGEVTLDLSAVGGTMLEEWAGAESGDYFIEGEFAAGQPVTFAAPSEQDWVLRVIGDPMRSSIYLPLTSPS